ncbi:MAG: hypothetical protein C0497_15235 [Gemmatimonas sp.]|nr:hypothetical protein [Gemmatimonas sp.]
MTPARRARPRRSPDVRGRQRPPVHRWQAAPRLALAAARRSRARRTRSAPRPCQPRDWSEPSNPAVSVRQRALSRQPAPTWAPSRQPR